MTWRIELEREAAKQLKKLDKPVRDRIRDYLDEVGKLPDPRMRGEGLHADKKGFWKYRIGKTRVLCEIHDDEMIVLALKVSWRKSAYDD